MPGRGRESQVFGLIAASGIGVGDARPQPRLVCRRPRASFTRAKLPADGRALRHAATLRLSIDILQSARVFSQPIGV
jgi:hypothetical protein